MVRLTIHMRKGVRIYVTPRLFNNFPDSNMRTYIWLPAHNLRYNGGIKPLITDPL